ncbi:hypothetical protein KR009_000118 [Drosophila setifemur]|nr:hypothetical protein KR009_000118 [Drosophila setifemur]
MSRPAMEERKPSLRIPNPTSNPPANITPIKDENAPSCSGKSVRDALERSVEETSGGQFRFLYGNRPKDTSADKGYEAGLDTDDPEEEEEIFQLPLRRGDSCLRDLSPLDSFVRPKPVRATRFSGLLRALAKSLYVRSQRFAAGLGLSRQQTAWYKHCWHSPDPDSEFRGLHLPGRVRSELGDGSSECTMNLQSSGKSPSFDSSTTL